MNQYQGSVGMGVLYGFGANILHIIATYLFAAGTSTNSLYVWGNIVFIGVVQLIYVVPLFFYFRRSGRTLTAKGLVIAASITALLNASCWGVLYFAVLAPLERHLPGGGVHYLAVLRP